MFWRTEKKDHFLFFAIHFVYLPFQRNSILSTRYHKRHSQKNNNYLQAYGKNSVGLYFLLWNSVSHDKFLCLLLLQFTCVFMKLSMEMLFELGFKFPFIQLIFLVAHSSIPPGHLPEHLEGGFSDVLAYFQSVFCPVFGKYQNDSKAFLQYSRTVLN